MKKLSSVIIFMLVTLTFGKEDYGTKFDNINVDELLKNERLFNNYVKCLKNIGPCTPDGKELKG